MQEVHGDITGTKRCPRCAEEIRAEAVVCRYCGAEFTNVAKGYCPSCHRSVSATEENSCPGCGGPLLDIHIESSLVAGREAAEPKSSVVPPAAPADEATASVGRTRTAVVPLGRERWGYRTLAIAGGSFFILMLWSVVGLASATSGQDAWVFTYWYKRSVVLGVEYGGPPVILFVLALVALLFQPKLLKPRTGAITSRLTGHPGYVREFRKSFGEVPLKEANLTTMLVGSVVAWGLILVVCLTTLGSWQGDGGKEIGALPYVAVALSLLALAGAALMWPTKGSRRVEMEDDGTVRN